MYFLLPYIVRKTHAFFFFSFSLFFGRHVGLVIDGLTLGVGQCGHTAQRGAGNAFPPEIK